MAKRTKPGLEVRASGSLRIVEIDITHGKRTIRERSMEFTYELGRAAGVIHEQLDLLPPASTPASGSAPARVPLTPSTPASNSSPRLMTSAPTNTRGKKR